MTSTASDVRRLHLPSRAGGLSLLILISTACGGDSSPTSPTPVITTPSTSLQASASIGPVGGVVEAPATSPLAGASVSIPAGALSQVTTITISRPPSAPSTGDLTQAGTFVDFGPDGQSFATPVTVTLPASSASGSEFVYHYTGAEFRPVAAVNEAAEGPAPLTASGTTVSIPVGGFSGKQVLRSSRVENACSAPGPLLTATETARCIRCTTRTQPISTIIVHSTNDGGAPFFRILSWILGSIGDATTEHGHRREAFFATYYINKDGCVVQLVNDAVQTSHTAGANTGTIGIELHDGGGSYTPAQVNALRTLSGQLMQRHGVTAANVRRHKDFTNDPLHQDPYRWTDADWNGFKASLPSTTTVTSVTVSCTPSTFTSLSQRGQCTASARLSDGTTQDRTTSATWSSSNSGVVSVSSSGALTPAAAGTATVRATVQNVQGSQTVTVNLTSTSTLTIVAGSSRLNASRVGFGYRITGTIDVTLNRTISPAPSRVRAEFEASLVGGSTTSVAGNTQLHFEVNQDTVACPRFPTSGDFLRLVDVDRLVTLTRIAWNHSGAITTICN